MAHLEGQERADYVQDMFARIAGRYDTMNRLMTAGQDVKWRKYVIEQAQLPENGRLRPPPPQPARFLLDIHLGQLTRTLRLLGFDSLYPDCTHHDADLAQIAHDEERILLTRDRGLLRRSLVVHGCCLRTTDPREQLTAVLHRYDLFDAIRETPRCLRCNGLLKAAAKESILDRLEPKTKLYYDEFQICADCEQIYWQGSHYPSLRAFIHAIQTGRNL